jgi:hypothetical protein
MKFSGIDMQGDYKAETVVDVSALVHTASDERRMVYDETTKQIYIADDTKWKSVGVYSNIPQNTVMWVYADAPPDGWSLYVTPGDALVAIKGGGTYTVGGDGNTYGDWATPSHSHGLANHTHTSSGTVNGAPGNVGGDNSGVAAAAGHTHSVNFNTAAAAGSTGIGGSSSAYRPRARVGILCTR